MKNNGEGTPLTHPASGATPLDTRPTEFQQIVPPRLNRYSVTAECPANQMIRYNKNGWANVGLV